MASVYSSEVNVEFKALWAVASKCSECLAGMDNATAMARCIKNNTAAAAAAAAAALVRDKRHLLVLEQRLLVAACASLLEVADGDTRRVDLG